jgi:hypothetical protein
MFERLTEYRLAVPPSEKPLSPRASLLVIALCSVAGWILLISIGAGLLRLGGYW